MSDLFANIDRVREIMGSEYKKSRPGGRGGGVLGIRHGSCMKPSRNDCRREADLRIHNEPGFSVGLPIRTPVSDCGMSHGMW